MDLVMLANFILSLVILAMGIWAYTSVKARSMLYVGTAFGLFAVTHLLTMLGQASALSTPILVVRIVAYLIIIYAIYIVIAKQKNA